MELRNACDAMARKFMEKTLPGSEPLSLDEWIMEYEDDLHHDDLQQARTILSLYYEYGGTF